MRKRNRSRMRVAAFVLGWAAAWAAGAAAGADWPRFRGPDGNGITADADWNPAGLAGGPKVAWKVQVGDGYSSMAVKGDRVYTMGSKARGKDTVFCLDAATGAEVWQHTYAGKGQPRATPTVHDGAVYTIGQGGQVYCLDAAKGEVRWTCDIVREFQAKEPGWGHSGSACVEGELLILNAGQSGLALNRKTGAKVWANTPGAGAHATPVVYGKPDARHVAIFGREHLYGVQAGDGKVLWSLPWKTSWDVNAPDPIPVDGRLFITSGYGRGCALVEAAEGAAKTVWENKSIASQFSGCVLIGGHIYGLSGNTGKGDMKCLEAATGAEKWSRQLGFGSFIVAGGKFIVLRDGGELILAEASPADFRELGRGKVLDRQCWTSPALAGGRVYCRNTPGDLVCVDLRR